MNVYFPRLLFCCLLVALTIDSSKVSARSDTTQVLTLPDAAINTEALSVRGWLYYGYLRPRHAIRVNGDGFAMFWPGQTPPPSRAPEESRSTPMTMIDQSPEQRQSGTATSVIHRETEDLTARAAIWRKLGFDESEAHRLASIEVVVLNTPFGQSLTTMQKADLDAMQDPARLRDLSQTETEAEPEAWRQIDRLIDRAREKANERGIVCYLDPDDYRANQRRLRTYAASRVREIQPSQSAGGVLAGLPNLASYIPSLEQNLRQISEAFIGANRTSISMTEQLGHCTVSIAWSPKKLWDPDDPWSADQTLVVGEKETGFGDGNHVAIIRLGPQESFLSYRRGTPDYVSFRMTWKGPHPFLYFVRIHKGDHADDRIGLVVRNDFYLAYRREDPANKIRFSAPTYVEIISENKIDDTMVRLRPNTDLLAAPLYATDEPFTITATPASPTERLRDLTTQLRHALVHRGIVDTLGEHVKIDLQKDSLRFFNPQTDSFIEFSPQLTRMYVWMGPNGTAHFDYSGDFPVRGIRYEGGHLVVLVTQEFLDTFEKENSGRYNRFNLNYLPIQLEAAVPPKDTPSLLPKAKKANRLRASS